MNAKPIIRKTLAGITLSLLIGVAVPATALAVPATASFGPRSSTFALSTVCPESATHPNSNGCALPEVTADQGTLHNIIQIVFGVIGAFALLSMTASGLKYITSGGDPQKTSEAKKGVVFALVGLMIAVSAEALVAFVVHRGGL